MASMKNVEDPVGVEADISCLDSMEYRLNFFSSIVEGSDDAIIGKTLDGMVLSWNKSAEKMYQYSSREVVGKSILILFPKEKINELEDILARVKNGERIDRFETIRMRKDGAIINVSLTIMPVIDGRGRIIGASTISHDISEDIYKKRKIEAAGNIISDRERFIRLVMDNVPAMVAYWNKDMYCKYHNKQYRDMYGKTKEEMERIGVFDLLAEKLFKDSEKYVRSVLQGEPQMFERTLTKEDGSKVYTLARYIPDDVDGNVEGFYVLISDVSELKTTQMILEQKVRELDILATTDTLTGIHNRRHFIRRASEEFSRSKRYGVPLSFLMVDADHFKSINDTYGHDVGDEVLKSIANGLKDTIRQNDCVGRLGGEEFGVLLIHTSLVSAVTVAERTINLLRSSCGIYMTSRVCVTLSVGVCEVSDDIDTLDELMRRADMALLQAKRSGRDRVCAYGESGQTSSTPPGELV